MLDKKTIIVLKALNKLADGMTYKVITCDELILSLSQKSQFDLDSVKQIIDFLEKQEYINIKFSEENTYCYAILPKGRIFLEQEGSKPKTKKEKISIVHYIYITLASFVGSLLALVVFFCLIF